MNKRKAKCILLKSKKEIQYIWEPADMSRFYLKIYVYIEHIFGKDSKEHDLFKVLAPESGMNYQKYHYGFMKIVDTLIEILENKGVQKQGNFLSRMNDTWLTTLLVAVFGVIFSSGYWAGQRDLIPLKSTDNVSKDEASPNKNKVDDKIHDSKNIDK